MDTHNPAVANKLDIPPAMLEEIQDNPTVLQPVARVMGAVNLHNMFVQVTHPEAPFTQRVEFQKLVNKIGRLEPDAAIGGGSGVTITINIPALDAQPERNVVIDQIAEPTFELSTVE